MENLLLSGEISLESKTTSKPGLVRCFPESESVWQLTSRWMRLLSCHICASRDSCLNTQTPQSSHWTPLLVILLLITHLSDAFEWRGSLWINHSPAGVTWGLQSRSITVKWDSNLQPFNDQTWLLINKPTESGHSLTDSACLFLDQRRKLHSELCLNRYKSQEWLVSTTWSHVRATQEFTSESLALYFTPKPKFYFTRSF